MINDRNNSERTTREKEFRPLPSTGDAFIAAVAITLATFVIMMMIIYSNGMAEDTTPPAPSTTTLAPAPDTDTSPVTVTVTSTPPTSDSR